MEEFARTVELHLSPDVIQAISDVVGMEALQAAIGRLSIWASSGYPVAKIYPDFNDPLDLVATYWTAEGERGYVIGAVWHEDHYGFHS